MQLSSLAQEHAALMVERETAHEAEHSALAMEIVLLERAKRDEEAASSAIIAELREELSEVLAEVRGARSDVTQTLEQWQRHALFSAMRHAFPLQLAPREQLEAAFQCMRTWAVLRRRSHQVASAFCNRATRHALSGWKELVRARLLMKRGLLALRDSVRRWALTRWMVMAIESLAAQDFLRAAVRRWKGALLASALRGWQQNTTSEVESRRRLHMAAREWRGASTRSMFIAWVASSEQQRRLRQAFNGIRMRARRAAFVQWQAGVTQAHDFKNVIAWATTVLSRVLSPRQRLKLRAFNSLRDAAQDRSMLRHAVIAILRSGYCRALNTWRAHATEFAERYHVLLRGSSGFRMRARRTAFAQWQAGVTQAHDFKNVIAWATAVLSRVMSPRQRLKLHAFNSLRDAAQDRAMLRHAVIAILRSGHLRALNTWRSYTAVRAESLQTMRLGMGSLRQSSLRKALNSWKTKDEQVRRSSGTPWRRSHAPQRRLLVTWRSFMIARLQGLQALKQAVMSLRCRSLRQGFNSLVAFAAAWGEACRALKVATASMRNLGLRQGFNGLAIHSKVALAARRALKVAALRWRGVGLRNAHVRWRLAASRFCKLARAVKRFRCASLGQGFNSFRANAMHASEQMAALHRAASCAFHHGVQRALRSWLELAAVQHEQLAVMQSVVMAVTHQQEHRAIAAWKQAVEDHAASIRALRQAVAALRSRVLRCGLGQWKASALSEAAVQHVLRSAAKAWLGVARRRAMLTWREAAANVAESKRQLRSAAKEWLGASYRSAFLTWVASSEQSLAMLLAFNGLRMRTRRAAFVKWRGVAADARTWHAHAGSVVSSILTPVLRLKRRAFNSLLEASGRCRCLLQAVRALLNGRCSQALRTWQAHTAIGKTELMQDMQRLMVLRESLAAMQFTNLRKAWTTWTEAAFDVRMAKRRLMVALRDLRGANMRKAFCAWGDAIHASLTLQRALTRLSHRGITQAFNTLCEHVIATLHATGKMRRAAARMTKRAVYSALQAWSHLSGHRRRQLDAARRVARITFFRGLYAALRAWRSEADSRRHAMRVLRRGAAALLCADMHQAFIKWSSEAEVKSVHQYKLSHAASEWLGDTMRKGLTTWLIRASQWHSISGAVRSLLLRGLRAGWNQWAHALERAQQWRCRARLAMGALDAAKWPVRKSFRAWLMLRWQGARLRRATTAVGRCGRVRRAYRTWSHVASLRKHRLRTVRLLSSAALHATWRLNQRKLARSWRQWRRRASAYHAVASERRHVALQAVWRRALERAEDEIEAATEATSNMTQELAEQRTVTAAALAARMLRPEVSEAEVRSGLQPRSHAELPVLADVRSPERSAARKDARSGAKETKDSHCHRATSERTSTCSDSTARPMNSRPPSAYGGSSPSPSFDIVSRAVERGRSPSPKRQAALAIPTSRPADTGWHSPSHSPVPSRSGLPAAARRGDGPRASHAPLVVPEVSQEVADRIRRALDSGPSSASKPSSTTPQRSAAPAVSMPTLEAGERWSTNASRRNVSPQVLREHPDHVLRSFAEQSKSALQSDAASHRSQCSASQSPTSHSQRPTHATARGRELSPTRTPSRAREMSHNIGRTMPSSPGPSSSPGRLSDFSEARRNAAVAGAVSLARAQRERERRELDREWKMAVSEAELRCRAAGIDPLDDASGFDPGLLQTIAGTPPQFAGPSTALAHQASPSPAQLSLQKRLSQEAWR